MASTAPPLMRGLTLPAPGGPAQLVLRDDLPVPPLPGPAHVRVRVVAAALNHLDLFVADGLPGIPLGPGWVPGADGAGIVDAVGADVTHVRPGDRVLLNPGYADGDDEYTRAGDQPLSPSYKILGEHVPGTLAEYVTCPATCAHAIPAGVSWDEAAAFPLATLTAWRMVHSRARVRAGQHVLIQGIGGGVALAALQMCRDLGAVTWVTSGSDEKLARAAALGATHGLNYRTTDVARAIRQATAKRGVDVVLDSVGTATWASSLGALGRAGRLVTCGGTSGPMLETDVRKLFWNQWTLMGSTMGSDEEFAAIVRELGAGRLRPVIDRVFALADGRAAYEHLASGAQFGKVVLRVTDAT
ncbi:MAG: zinc-binding dehydrogenase [Gemmatimonadaceae bacterium]|jgi:NADPH:quinone reductase-like Zn-dependent oxidoreductase|nr:zinc-binding dehydrogenase [Gemmatimonadaceae bacterium]